MPDPSPSYESTVNNIYQNEANYVAQTWHNFARLICTEAPKGHRDFFYYLELRDAILDPR